MKALKILLTLIIVVILLLVVTVIALPQLVDPNDYKEEITATVKSRTGLDLIITEDFSLSVFPWLGIKTGSLTLAQPKAVAASGDFISVAAANINVKLKPLLQRELEIDTILLKSPKIEIMVNRAGLSSVDAVLNKFQSEETTTATPSQNQSKNKDTNEAAAIAALTIAGIDITDGHILYNDKKTGTIYEAKQLNIVSGNLLSGQPTPLTLEGQLSGNAFAPTTITLDSQVTLNQKNQRVNLDDIAASIKQQHQPELAFSIPKAYIDIAKTNATISAFSARSQGITLSGDMKVKEWDKTLTVVSHLTTNTFNARALLAQLGIDYTPTNASALTKVKGSVKVTASPKGVSLQKLKLTLDESALTGHIAIINMAQPQYRFDLALDNIVIDSYLPKTTVTADASAQTSTSATANLLAPLALFNNILAKGDFRANSVQANNLKVSDIDINVVSDKRLTTIKPMLNLYQGNLNGTINLSKSKSPMLTTNISLNNIALEPLLTDAGITDQFSGIGNLNTNITVTEKNGKTSPQGTVKLLAKDGAIKGIDIKKVLDEAQTVIDQIRGKSSSSSSSSDDETRFAEMSATLLVNNDVISNNDLAISAPLFRISGKGSINTTQQTLDYLTSIVAVNTNSGQGGKSLDKLKGITIPVRFTGPLTAPSYKLDASALLKANSQTALEKEKDKLKDKLLKKLGISSDSNTQSTASQATTTEQPAEETTQKDQQSLEEKLKDDLKRKLFKKLF